MRGCNPLSSLKACTQQKEDTCPLLRFTVWLSLVTTVLSWRSALPLPGHIADSFPGFEGFELWRPLDEGGDYFVVTRLG